MDRIKTDVREVWRREPFANMRGNSMDAPGIIRWKRMSYELKAAASAVGRKDERVLKGMIENVARFHRSQPRLKPRTYRRQGLIVTETPAPVERALVYVPGGTAPYPSSLVMVRARPQRSPGSGRSLQRPPPTTAASTRTSPLPPFFSGSRVSTG